MFPKSKKSIRPENRWYLRERGFGKRTKEPVEGRSTVLVTDSRDPPKNVLETKLDEPKKRKLERENSEANQWRAKRMQNLEDNLITISSVKANQSVKRPGSATGKQTV